jgi:hypothetical protein
MNWTVAFEAFMAVVVTIATGMSLLIKKQLGSIDESVNHKHKHGRTETLYDLQHAQSIILNDMKEDLTSLIEVNQNDHIEIFKRISELQDKHPIE